MNTPRPIRAESLPKNVRSSGAAAPKAAYVWTEERGWMRSGRKVLQRRLDLLEEEPIEPTEWDVAREHRAQTFPRSYHQS